MAVISRIFSQSTLKNLLHYGYDEVYQRAVTDYLPYWETYTNHEVFKAIYEMIRLHYRNEYYYKNTIVNKLLLGRHNLNTTTALSELPIATSKADLIMINGNGTVYEIKTELDNLERLRSQVEDYYKAFDRVCVVTSESHFKALERALSRTNVGISVLTERTAISPRKAAISDLSFLDLEVMFSILRKYEWENILQRHYGYLPDVVPVRYYSACKALFTETKREEAHAYTLRELKLRNQTDVVSFRSLVPYELKSLVYFAGFRNRDYAKLTAFLQGGVQDVLSIFERAAV